MYVYIYVIPVQADCVCFHELQQSERDAATKRMTKDNYGKPDASNVEKAGKARRRRLEILRLRSVPIKPTPEAKPKVGTCSMSQPSDPQPSTSSAKSSESSKADENTAGCSGEVERPSGSKSGGLVFSHVSMMGRRRVMEDAVAVAPPGFLPEEYSFFAVYDGHGGAKVAEKCREKMHECLEKHIEKEKKLPDEKGFDWERVMLECFRSMDEELEQEYWRRDEVMQGDDREAAERMMGSTATVVVVGKEEVVAANCGDSRAVLCRGGVVVPLSRDHKVTCHRLLGLYENNQPDRADEKERIEAAGGRIINWNGWRVEGVLATSRSLGDRYLKPYVCSEPEVTVVRRSESDDFLIIGTDGLFDVVCNEVACDVVRRCLSGQLRRQGSERTGVSEAATMLAELAIAKGSKDNISVIVVQMK